jgi:hypothetical protein
VINEVQLFCQIALALIGISVAYEIYRRHEGTDQDADEAS